MKFTTSIQVNFYDDDDNFIESLPVMNISEAETKSIISVILSQVITAEHFLSKSDAVIEEPPQQSPDTI